jgi:hypothetical protein
MISLRFASAMMMIHLEPARTQKTAHSDARRHSSIQTDAIADRSVLRIR